MLSETSSANAFGWNKKPLNERVNPIPSLSYDLWHEELGDDPDRAFILEGIKHGFDVIDQEVEITPVRGSNHLSAQPWSPFYDKATQQVLKEIENGNYVFCDTPPKIISPNGCDT